MSLTTTTQKLLAAHARHLITIAMSSTADKRHNDAAVEPDNTGHVSDEWANHNVEVLSYSNTLGDAVLDIFS